jgi:hypothetical protein
MKRTIGRGVVIVGLLTGACVSPQHRTAQQAQFQNTVPTCESPKNCEVKWAAARRFILENSKFKIQTMTNDFLETYSGARNTSVLAYRVVKEPIDATRYRIVVTTGCRNTFACVPDAWDAALRFNQYVNAQVAP